MGINFHIKSIKKDWESLNYLKDKVNKITTKEEIEKFHKKYKTNNLRGLYKQYKK
jgi:hypothetical protein